MRTEINAVACSLLCMLLICGCTGGATAPEAAYVNATFEGEKWNSMQARAVRTSLLSMITISATRNTTTGQDSILLSMANVAITGTYQMAMSAANGRITIGGILYAIGAGNSKSQGEITFTKFGKGRIAGTFKMTVYRDGIMSNPPKKVTEGSFDMALAE